MLRPILGVVVGYVALAVVCGGLFMALWFGLGPDGIFEPGTYKGNMVLNIGAPLFSVIGALLGGWVCAKISRSCRAVFVFSAIVLIAGQIAAYYTVEKPLPGPRDPKWTAKEALDHGREPNWYALLNPLIGWGGILVGGLCLGRKCGKPRT